MATDVVAQNAQALATLTDSAEFYSSLSLTSRADKLKVLNAVNNSTPLVDMVGKNVLIKDVVMQSVQIVKDADTGEVDSAIRTVLIDAEGNAYHATSKGLVQSLRQVFKMFGEPTWDEPLEANVREQRGRNGFRFITLDFVG